MNLIIVRHAERDGTQEPALTANGQRQAQALATELFKLNPQRVFASPRKRARQTMQPLAEMLGTQVEVRTALDERTAGETSSQFQQRVQQWLADLAPQSAVGESMVYCTHLDWLEAFRQTIDCNEDLLTAPYDQWSPAQYLVLKFDAKWHVVAYQGV